MNGHRPAEAAMPPHPDAPPHTPPPAGERYIDRDRGGLVVVLGDDGTDVWCWSPGSDRPVRLPAAAFAPGGRLVAEAPPAADTSHMPTPETPS